MNKFLSSKSFLFGSPWFLSLSPWFLSPSNGFCLEPLPECHPPRFRPPAVFAIPSIFTTLNKIFFLREASPAVFRLAFQPPKFSPPRAVSPPRWFSLPLKLNHPTFPAGKLPWSEIILAGSISSQTYSGQKHIWLEIFPAY